MLDIMTPSHPRWDEFIERLEGPEGCNFHENSNGEMVWSCTSDIDNPHARHILERMGGFDIEQSCEYFEHHGGYCDCEILFNVGGN
jgi:Protein of unknown function (DUF2695)